MTPADFSFRLVLFLFWGGFDFMKVERKPRPRAAVIVTVVREFVGDKTVAEVFVPVLIEDMRRTLDKPPNPQ